MEEIDKIKLAELITVKLPLATPFETSFSIHSHKEALLVKLSSSDGHGWGECIASPDPYYSNETNQTAYLVIKNYLAPMIMDMRHFTPQDALNAFKRIRGHHMAKAVVENALLDLLARVSEMPLFDLIGGKSKRIKSGISIGIKDSPDTLLAAIQHALDKKYHRVKLKIKKGKDIDLLRTVRRTFPNVNLMVDANGDYSRDDFSLLSRLDEFQLMMMEQPLSHNDIYQHSLLQRRIETPICLDESIKNFEDVEAAAALGSCRLINIKQGRLGGILKSKEIQAFCTARGIEVWTGGMLETGIGRAFNIHLQTLPGFELPGDTSETVRYFAEDIVDRPVVLEPDGFITIPEGTGIGVDVVPEKLNKFTTFYEKITI